MERNSIFTKVQSDRLVQAADFIQVLVTDLGSDLLIASESEGRFDPIKRRYRYTESFVTIR